MIESMIGVSDLSSDGVSNADALERLRRAAEMEMRRVLDDSRPRKRPRGPKGEIDTYVPMDRFHYSVVQELEAGSKGFLVTCNFRQEKSATREASQLLRRYLPEHLFPPAATLSTAVDEHPPGALGPPGGELPSRVMPMTTAVTGESVEGTDPVKCHGGAAAAAPSLVGDMEGDGAKPQAETGSLKQQGVGQGGSQPNQALDVVRPARGCGSSERDELQALEAVAGGGQGSGGGTTVYADDGSEEDEDAADDGDGGGGLSVGGGGGAHGGGGGGGGLPALGLAKVSCRGVVLIRLSAAAAAEVDPVRVVESMLADLESGTLQPPKHCQRIVPLDATCLLTPSGIAAAVAEAAAAFKRRRYKSTARCTDSNDGNGGGGGDAAPVEPFSYAISYHSRFTESLPQSAAAGADGGNSTYAGNGAAHRGGQEQEHALPPLPPPPQQQGQEVVDVLLDRNQIISLAARGMVDAFTGDVARVNLKKPQVAVRVEALPVGGRQFAGLTLLPEHMFVSKGKLVVKALVKNANSYPCQANSDCRHPDMPIRHPDRPIQAQHSPIPRLHSAIRIPSAGPPEQFQTSAD
ncbi:hypothetical protein VOLCADRAFT_89304 [Volvox carteri f. nagariensis]|uniref:Uncharacterized protein n=1 Tax=Volvox carteri f. nagariensis TaxID=3068 RepID=D8TRC8_VOLCA|nr:uncharacterized protein VOLCADRAFT_89304 [Volvox carteri f. nagariensis]EFJ49870.1 hypothetical protein VOLCADRAFT_89304 [Volvox carteri f. nagariensis]|eukprot:XP_002948935.1 hypothetical protein VOLCADRAFT_89304 [Volvox carteri f. nagariensis]